MLVLPTGACGRDRALNRYRSYHRCRCAIIIQNQKIVVASDKCLFIGLITIERANFYQFSGRRICLEVRKLDDTIGITIFYSQLIV